MSDEIKKLEENETPEATTPSAELPEAALDKVTGGNLQHDMQKAVANNIRT